MAVYYYGYWFRDDCLVSQATYLHTPRSSTPRGQPMPTGLNSLRSQPKSWPRARTGTRGKPTGHTPLIDVDVRVALRSSMQITVNRGRATCAKARSSSIRRRVPPTREGCLASFEVHPPSTRPTVDPPINCQIYTTIPGDRFAIRNLEPRRPRQLNVIPFLASER